MGDASNNAGDCSKQTNGNCTAAIKGTVRATIPDIEAYGSGAETIDAWRQKRGIDTSQQIKTVRLVHMRYQHPDLDTITVFLQDFGMQIVQKTETQVYFKGYGPDQYLYYAQKGPKRFLGGAFEVASYEDLIKASQLDGAESIQSLDGAPGGGHLVTAYDAEGHPINFIYGQTPGEPGAPPKKLTLNHEIEKLRERQIQRLGQGPAAVYKLGHYGLCVIDFDAQLDWYTRNINLVPSSFISDKNDAGAEEDVTFFAHIDKGEELVDHHQIFLNRAKTTHIHHCSFEVHDFDTLQLGHHWLRHKGYKSVWGVGRHVFGSQLFDYWWDPTGNMIEHYTDCDLVTQDTPIGRRGTGPGMEAHAVWAPEVPQEYLD